MNTCTKAERLAEQARKGDWRVKLDYITGPVREVFTDGSDYIHDEERAVLTISEFEWEEPGMVVGWGRDENSGRWKMLDRPTLLFGGKQYEVSLSYVESMVKQPSYRDWSMYHGQDALYQPLDGDEEE